MKTFYHWTESRNLTSIKKGGLSGKYAIGVKKVVWCFRKGSEAEAMACVLKHHKVNPMTLVLLKIEVAPNDLRMHGGGLYYSKSDIPPSRVTLVGKFGKV